MLLVKELYLALQAKEATLGYEREWKRKTKSKQGKEKSGMKRATDASKLHRPSQPPVLILAPKQHGR
jgi:hypothetical protein